MCEILLPSDDSPGARQAGVGYYLDTVLLYADAKRQNAWRGGVQQVERAATEMFGKPFSACTTAQQTEIMTRMAENESHPQEPLQHFFAILKPAAIEAFCLSDAGMRDYLHYRGNQVLADFPGCPSGHHAGRNES